MWATMNEMFGLNGSQNSRWCNTNYCEGPQKHWKGPHTAREHKSFFPHCGPLGPESTTDTSFVRVERLCHSSTGILDGNILTLTSTSEWWVNKGVMVCLKMLLFYCKSSSPQAQAVQHYIKSRPNLLAKVLSETVKAEFMQIGFYMHFA